MVNATQGKITNEEFASRVGIHFTMASKLRNGSRKPSVETLIAMRDAFGLDGNDILDAYSKGAESLGEYVRQAIFNEES